jgi:hypothetical protein
MAAVRDWFGDFMAAVIERTCRGDDLPEPGSEFWSDFERSLVRIGAIWPHADEALSIVCDSKVFPSDIRPAIVAEIRRLQGLALASGGAGTSVHTREEAEAASRGCQDCSGAGYAHRFVHEDILGLIRTARGNDVPVGYEFAVPCSCALGQLAAHTLRKPGQTSPILTIDKYPALRREPVEWTDSPDGLDNRHRYRPAHWDAARGRPLEPEFPIRSVDDLRTLVRSLAARSRHETSEANRRWLAEAEARRKRESPPAPVERDPGPLPEEAPGWF